MSPPVQPVISDDKLPASADVVVIGAGIAGSAAAYALSKKGLSVALLDKGVVGGEQSSRNWGWCRQQHRDLRELPLAMKSLEIWGDLNARAGRRDRLSPHRSPLRHDAAATISRSGRNGPCARATTRCTAAS